MNKKPSYCPDWFDLKNYEPCKEYTREAWIKVIEQRAHIHSHARLDYYDLLSKTRIEKKQLLEYLKDSLIQNIESFASYDCLNMFNDSSSLFFDEADIDNTSVQLSRIWDFDSSDFCNVFESVKRKSINLIDLIDGIVSSEIEYTDKGSRDYHYLGEYLFDDDLLAAQLNIQGIFKSDLEEYFHFITIDLNATDAILIEQFKEWLHQKRTEIGYPSKNHKRATDREIEKYSEQKILPYIDLLLWGELTGVKFTQTQIANLLFPDEYEVNTVERITKTTAKKANMLLKYGKEILE